jgi:serine protease Do
MSVLRNSIPVLFGLVAIAFIVGVVTITGLNIGAEPNGEQEVLAEAETLEPSVYKTALESTQTAPTIENFSPGNMFVEVVKRVRPSIVSIYTSKSVKIPANPWHRFFRDFGFDQDQRFQDEDAQERTQQGLGSGIIISEDGYILTNHHVVKDMDELNVKLIDGKEYKAELIGSDPTTEVALIKIDADGLQEALLGNSDNLQIGEWVLAIGSPYSLEFTVTAGIVSALSRDINIIQERGYAINNFIQTDAAINPGNSGGALINYQGNVVGINTAIASPTGSYIGYGFAIPINLAKSVMDDFRKYGKVNRGYLGIQIKGITSAAARSFGLDKVRGVLVLGVQEGRAADKAGIKEDDIILSVNGTEVNKPNQLQANIGSNNPGDEVTLEIWRDGKKKTVKVKLEGLEEEAEPVAREKVVEENITTLIGINVTDLDDRQLSQLGLDDGVVVASVKNNSPADKAGIGRGDVIYKIDNDEVKSAKQFDDYIDDLEKGDVVRMRLVRRTRSGQTFKDLVFVEIPKK